jgi:hypothetical protein
MLLAHFDDNSTETHATAAVAVGDSVSPVHAVETREFSGTGPIFVRWWARRCAVSRMRWAVERAASSGRLDFAKLPCMPVSCSSLFSLVLALLPALSLAQEQLATGQGAGASLASSFTGHYEGAATNKAQQIIPLIIDLRDASGTLSGRITTPLGIFPINGGTQQANAITIHFETDGESGSISATLTDRKLLGTFSLGDDGGPIEARKTAEVPLNPAEGKSHLATPIMFLGVYHMHNPGLDAVNLQADDVLAPKRQREIEELAERLAGFRPTKIAIEAQYRDTYWSGQYQKYVAGQYTLGRNEIEQIAFRLAKRLNLPTLYGVDYVMFMNGLTPSEIEDPKPSKTGSNESQTTGAPRLSPEDELLRRSTVTEYLFHLNSASDVQKNHEEYMTMLLPNNGPAIYRSADLVSNWYKRNLRIFADINRITEPGKDRILVIIGAGHLKLLKEFAADSPYFSPVDVESLLKP